MVGSRAVGLGSTMVATLALTKVDQTVGWKVQRTAVVTVYRLAVLTVEQKEQRWVGWWVVPWGDPMAVQWVVH
jgi:hypothetical protein